MNRKRPYRGKYPNRIRSIYTVPNVAVVTTNNGMRFSIRASDTPRHRLPKINDDATSYRRSVLNLDGSTNIILPPV